MFGTSRPFFGMADKIDVSKTKKHPVLCLCNQVAERPDCWVVKAYPAGQVNGETPKGDVLQWFKRSKKTPDHLSEVVGQWEKMDISNWTMRFWDGFGRIEIERPFCLVAPCTLWPAILQTELGVLTGLVFSWCFRTTWIHIKTRIAITIRDSESARKLWIVRNEKPPRSLSVQLGMRKGKNKMPQTFQYPVRIGGLSVKCYCKYTVKPPFLDQLNFKWLAIKNTSQVLQHHLPGSISHRCWPKLKIWRKKPL